MLLTTTYMFSRLCSAVAEQKCALLLLLFLPHLFLTWCLRNMSLPSFLFSIDQRSGSVAHQCLGPFRKWRETNEANRFFFSPFSVVVGVVRIQGIIIWHWDNFSRPSRLVTLLFVQRLGKPVPQWIENLTKGQTRS